MSEDHPTIFIDTDDEENISTNYPLKHLTNSGESSS